MNSNYLRPNPVNDSSPPSPRADGGIGKDQNVAPHDNGLLNKPAEAQGERLRASELSYRRLFEAARDGILILDVDTGCVTDVNPFLVELLGFSRSEIVGKSVGELSPFKDSLPNQSMLERLQKDGYVRYENLSLETRDGRKIAVEFVSNVYQAGDKKVIQCNIRDITERKRTETAALEAKHFLRSTLDALSAHIAILDEHGTVVAVNAAWKRFADDNKFKGSNGVGENYLKICDSVADHCSEEALAVSSGIRTVMAGQSAEFNWEYSCHSPTEKRWFVVRVTRFSGDGPVRVVVAHENISIRKHIEMRFRRLVDSNAQGVVFWNTQGQITEANAAFLKLVGCTRANLEAGPIDWRAMTPPKYADIDQRALKELTTTGVCKPYEKEYIRKDGTRVSVLIGAAAFEDDPGEGVAFVLDLTERKLLEQQFRQAQKMESIGTLASGVAHDFNNILAVIQMQVGLLKSEGKLSAAQSDLADDIGNAVQRAVGLTRQLLLFSRTEVLQPCDLDLNRSVAEMTKMLKRILGENIAVQLKLAAQPMFLHADAGMMDQVLMNLAVNARDAMLNGGQLVIETAGVEFDEFAATQTAQARPGSFVRLSVCDNGCGIPPENLGKIFEPFFTTKAVGKGTGLGLATVFGIAQQHHGWVNVQSEVGHGTTFTVYLPRLSESQDAKIIKKLSTTALTGCETILLVEDEPALRTMIGKTLTRLGYRVLEASTGFRALDVWKEYPAEIHLLLTDLMMPDGMTGKELGLRLLQENPKLKVIYMSGYSADIVAQDFSLQEGVNFLVKPFQSQKLAETIRDRLDASLFS